MNNTKKKKTKNNTIQNRMSQQYNSNLRYCTCRRLVSRCRPHQHALPRQPLAFHCRWPLPVLRLLPSRSKALLHRKVPGYDPCSSGILRSQGFLSPSAADESSSRPASARFCRAKDNSRRVWRLGTRSTATFRTRSPEDARACIPTPSHPNAASFPFPFPLTSTNADQRQPAHGPIRLSTWPPQPIALVSCTTANASLSPSCSYRGPSIGYGQRRGHGIGSGRTWKDEDDLQ